MPAAATLPVDRVSCLRDDGGVSCAYLSSLELKIAHRRCWPLHHISPDT